MEENIVILTPTTYNDDGIRQYALNEEQIRVQNKTVHQPTSCRWLSSSKL